MLNKMLYVSSVDISLSDGPGVNEREFINALYKYSPKSAHFIIPKPKYGLPDGLDSTSFSFSKPHNKRNPILWPIHQFSTYRKFSKQWKSAPPNLLIFRTPVFAFAYLFIVKKCGIPFCLRAEGLGKVEVFKRKNFFWRFLSGINFKIQKKLLSNALMVDTVNKSNVSKLKAITGNSGNIVWIDNAVNTDRFKPDSITSAREKLGLSKFDPLVGYVGNYPWERGGLQIIESLPFLRKKYPNIGVVILGGGDGLQILKDKSKELDVEDRCVLTGQVPLDEVPDYINAIDVGVSISIPKNREMASELKVRQYISGGKPILVSPGGSEYLAEIGFGSVVEPENIKQIVSELERWISMSEDEKTRFAKKAHQYAVNHLSYVNSVQKRLSMWQELLSKN